MTTHPPAIEMVTLGCRLNTAESATMHARAQAAGLRDAVIVNTCAVTNEAVRQARQAIRRARRERPDASILVTGCAAQIAPDDFAAMPEVTRVIGNADKLEAEAYTDRARVRVPAWPLSQSAFAQARDGRARAVLQVQNGCDHRCTFCIIPMGRGPTRSTPIALAAQAARDLDASGCAEIVLTGVDLTAWGTDLPGAPRLGDLIEAILEAAPNVRVRLSSVDVAEIDAKLLALIRHEPRIAPHLHLSLQHGADLILKRMKRRHSRAQAIAFCVDLRARRPEIALGADLIAGFPTETDDHFSDLLSLVDACGLAFLHVFPFSAREGAPASRMPPLAPAVIKSRAAALRAKGQDALRRHLDAWVGRGGEALVERTGFARLPDFTGVRLAQIAQHGQRVQVMFTAHDGAHLIGAL